MPLSYFILSFPRSEEEEVRTKNVWMKGHKGRFIYLFAKCHLAHIRTDIGSITLLWSQPVAALQIQTKEGWRWVKHIDNALVCISLVIDLFIFDGSLDRQCW
jgi:isopenicillin N synthase-like dioxygenase